MLVEVDTSIRGLAELLASLARVNLIDAAENTQLAAELVRRCGAPPGDGWRYRLDRGADRWTTFKVLLERARNGPLVADCEDQSGGYAAGILLMEPWRSVEAAITQPRPGAMAHAYLIVDGQVFDPSTFNGMPAPPADFYGSGETARVRVEVPR